MAKQLSNKVERCPECGKLKSKTKPCKYCGCGAEKAPVVPKAAHIKIDAPQEEGATLEFKITHDYIILNGVTFVRR